MRIDLEGERVVASGCRAGAGPRRILPVRRTISIALVVAMNVAPLEAHADWQYTRWGMTPEQVMAASTGQLKACDKTCKGRDTSIQIARFLGPYQPGPFKFTAHMIFDTRNNALAQVLLDLNRPNDTDALIDALMLKYGTPIAADLSEPIQIMTWHNSTDVIDLVVMRHDHLATDTSISFAPRQNLPTETFDAFPLWSPRIAVPASYLTMWHAVARVADVKMLMFR